MKCSFMLPGHDATATAPNRIWSTNKQIIYISSGGYHMVHCEDPVAAYHYWCKGIRNTICDQ